MTKADLKINLGIAKSLLEQKKQTLETQRQLAAAGKSNSLAYAETAFTMAALEVRKIEKAIEDIEETERQALFDWKVNQSLKTQSINKESDIPKTIPIIKIIKNGIMSILIGLIIAWLVYKFGWNK